jgi:hypothetical protein
MVAAVFASTFFATFAPFFAATFAPFTLLAVFTVFALVVFVAIAANYISWTAARRNISRLLLLHSIIFPLFLLSLLHHFFLLHFF